MNRFASLILFLLLVVGGGVLIGLMNEPAGWYAGLRKPPFNPPSWLFGPVWSTLYVLIAIAGWRIWRDGRNGTAKFLWVGQLALNFLWSPVFFGMQRIGPALLLISVLDLLILSFIRHAWRRDRIAAWLFVPYAAWVAFATVLNASILWLNS